MLRAGHCEHDSTAAGMSASDTRQGVCHDVKWSEIEAVLQSDGEIAGFSPHCTPRAPRIVPSLSRFS
jgi:hypothetical protein